MSVLASDNNRPIIQPLPDVTLPTWNTWAQKLSDHRGHALVIIVLPQCNACEQALIQYQLYLESLQHQGLSAWLVWPHSQPPPVSFRLPVLRYQTSVSPDWLAHEQNSVLYINTHGELERVVALNVRRDFESWSAGLRAWLTAQAPKAHLY